MTDSKTTSHICPDKRQYWQQHISAWRHSGQSQAAYCRTHGLKHHQMVYWKRRLSDAQSEVSFVPLTLSQHLPVPVNPSTLRLHTPNGYRIDVPGSFDADVLKKIITAVRYF